MVRGIGDKIHAFGETFKATAKSVAKTLQHKFSKLSESGSGVLSKIRNTFNKNAEKQSTPEIGRPFKVSPNNPDSNATTTTASQRVFPHAHPSRPTGPLPPLPERSETVKDAPISSTALANSLKANLPSIPYQFAMDFATAIFAVRNGTMSREALLQKLPNFRLSTEDAKKAETIVKQLPIAHGQGPVSGDLPPVPSVEAPTTAPQSPLDAFNQKFNMKLTLDIDSLKEAQKKLEDQIEDLTTERSQHTKGSEDYTTLTNAIKGLGSQSEALEAIIAELEPQHEEPVAKVEVVTPEPVAETLIDLSWLLNNSSDAGLVAERLANDQKAKLHQLCERWKNGKFPPIPRGYSKLAEDLRVPEEQIKTLFKLMGVFDAPIKSDTINAVFNRIENHLKGGMIVSVRLGLDRLIAQLDPILRSNPTASWSLDDLSLFLALNKSEVERRFASCKDGAGNYRLSSIIDTFNHISADDKYFMENSRTQKGSMRW